MELFVLSYLQSQYFWTATAFLLLLVVMTRVVVPAVLATLDARAAKIARDLDAARTTREQAEASLADYTAKIAAAKKEAAELLSQARAEAEALAKARLAQADEELARKTEIAKQQIDASKAEALRAVRAEVAKMAVTVAEKLVGQAVDAKVATQLTDKALAQGFDA
ncbi:MAG: F0F1 ATP synthase subunit B [Alphaproteobacteria bacterium]|nr:F0F1 ATP synthase subunit B [Alphaproteobacteria bacterium]